MKEKIELIVDETARNLYAIKANRDREWIWHLEHPDSVANEYIAARVRKAIAKAVAGEREACAVQLEEAAAFYEKLGSDIDPHIAAALRQEAASIRSRGEGEGEGKT